MNTSDDQRERLRKLIDPQDASSWDEAWKQSITPWDAGQSQPPLVQLFQSNEVDLATNGRAIVPGCGAGYDAIYLASVGFDVIGLDISETALEKAKSLTPSELKNKVQFQSANFFDLKDEKFDLIYDYTFFVAIHPMLRSSWGSQMRSLIKPGGYLITLIWPIAPYTDQGPPYYVRPEHYPEVLGDDWEKVLDREDWSAEDRKGNERLIVWRRV
ncbi:thiol methyltransferase 1 [Moniliophthora roreri MCA 2997]|uniref:Thiol methyltransferase 1 n=1 Tax=Moniliophthora roreri (strain MCA 2997) TaxID=1381753 RepID=V2X2Q0_MONRO|nr:thiol methyltransferase 1 [Moniliophthora roreri MCA 2997]